MAARRLIARRVPRSESVHHRSKGWERRLERRVTSVTSHAANATELTHFGVADLAVPEGEVDFGGGDATANLGARDGEWVPRVGGGARPRGR